MTDIAGLFSLTNSCNGFKSHPGLRYRKLHLTPTLVDDTYNLRHDHRWLAQPPRPRIPASQPTVLRPDELIPERFQFRDILLRHRMFPHAIIHRRGEHDRTGGGADHQADQVVA